MKTKKKFALGNVPYLFQEEGSHPPRLFQLSNATGNIDVEEIHDFVQVSFPDKSSCHALVVNIYNCFNFVNANSCLFVAFVFAGFFTNFFGKGKEAVIFLFLILVKLEKAVVNNFCWCYCNTSYQCSLKP